MWNELKNESHDTNTSQTTQPEGNIKRAKFYASIGRYSKAIESLTSHGIANVDESILQQLIDKHPRHPRPNLPVDIPINKDVTAQSYAAESYSLLPNAQWIWT